MRVFWFILKGFRGVNNSGGSPSPSSSSINLSCWNKKKEVYPSEKACFVRRFRHDYHLETGQGQGSPEHAGTRGMGSVWDRGVCVGSLVWRWKGMCCFILGKIDGIESDILMFCILWNDVDQTSACSLFSSTSLSFQSNNAVEMLHISSVPWTL